MKNTKKKSSVMDKALSVVLVMCAVVIVVAIASSMFDGGEENKETKKETTKAAVEEETPVDEAYITRYSCLISEGTEDETSGSAFYLELYENNGTYKKFLKAGEEKSTIGKGTFTREKEGIKLTSKEGAVSNLYQQGDYLITDTAIYKGKVPKKETFDKTFISESTGENKVEMKFKKNGKFTQQIVRYGAKLDGNDTSDETDGTYQRKGHFIYRTKSDGTKMMPLYLYKDQICTSYYKWEKTGKKE